MAAQPRQTSTQVYVHININSFLMHEIFVRRTPRLTHSYPLYALRRLRLHCAHTIEQF